MDAIASKSPIEINLKYMIEQNEEYEVIIYGPILGEITELKIEIPENSNIEYLNRKKNKTALILGGIHSFGVGCTASGVMFPNIIGRKFDLNIINASFNEKNFLKNTYNYLKKNKKETPDFTILELDYIWQNDRIFKKYIEKIIKQIKSKNNYLICWHSIPKTMEKKHEKLRELSEKYSNDEKIVFFDFSFLYNEEYSEMCTHSKNFINDTGNIMIYKKISEYLKKIN